MFKLLLLSSALVFSALSPASAFDCALQTGPTGYDKIPNCETYCVVLFYQNVLIPSFVTGGKPICSAFGCGKLVNGKFDESVIRSPDFPGSGDVVVYTVTEAERTTKAEFLEAKAADPVNVYSSFAGKCTGLTKLTTISLTVKKSDNDSLITGLGIASAFVGLACCVACYIRYYKRTDEDILAEVEKERAAMMNQGTYPVAQPQGRAMMPAAPTYQQPIYPPQPSAGGMAQDQSDAYAVGSAEYNELKRQLINLYNSKGAQDQIGKADYVLTNYVTRKGGLQKLNEKLISKYNEGIKGIDVQV